MKTHTLFFILLFSNTLLSQTMDQRVRTVFVAKDQIVKVKTSLGIASIVSVPEKPSSVVLGDTEAFKVEYLDQAITIKPLHAGAQSNLYIFTDYQRFNVHLVTGGLTSADYVVYLKGKSSHPLKPTASWHPFNKSVLSGEILLTIERLGRKPDGSYLMVCVLSSRKKVMVNPNWFHLLQRKKTVAINQVYLSSKIIDLKTPVQAVLLIRPESVKSKEPWQLVLDKKPIVAVDLPKGELWK